MRASRRRTKTGSICGMIILAVWTCRAMAAEHPYLSDAPLNQAWHAPASSDEAIFVGGRDTHEPQLALKKEPLTKAPLLVHILSDAKTCILASGEAQIELALEPDQTNALLLDGRAERPTLQLGDRELAPLRGKWIGLVLRDAAPTLTLRLVGATYANIRFGAGRPTLKIKDASDRPAPAADAALPPAQISRTPLPPPATAPAAVTIIAEPSVKTAPIPGDSSAIIEPTNLWNLFLSAGVDYTTAYFYRGIGRENQDIILQPWAELKMRVFDNSANTSDIKLLRFVDLDFGLRSSHQWGPSGGSSPLGEKWVEFDWHGGVTTGFLERWTLGIDYDNVESIRTAFRDVHQFNFKLAYDDHDPDYKWSLQPYGLVSVEYEHQSDAGWLSSANSVNPKFHEGIYLELGVRPSFELFRLRAADPVTLSIPMAVGLSASDYYENLQGRDDTFGYFDTGLELGIPLGSVPAAGSRRFAWKLTAAVHFLCLGDTARDLSIINGTGDSHLVTIGTLGIRLDY